MNGRSDGGAFSNAEAADHDERGKYLQLLLSIDPDLLNLTAGKNSFQAGVLFRVERRDFMTNMVSENEAKSRVKNEKLCLIDGQKVYENRRIDESALTCSRTHLQFPSAFKAVLECTLSK